MSLKTKWNSIQWVKIFSIIIIILAIVVTYKIASYYVGRKTAEKYELYRRAYADSIQYYRDKNGNVVAQVFERPISQAHPSDQKRIDSILEVLDVTKKERDRALEIASRTDFSKSTGKRDTIYYPVDSNHLPTYAYSYRSRFLDYDAHASDSLRFNKFEVRDSLYVVPVKKKVGKEVYTDIVLKNINPAVTITGARAYRFKDEKEYSPLSLGASAGVTYINGKAQPYVGVGVNYDIIRFKKKK